MDMQSDNMQSDDMQSDNMQSDNMQSDNMQSDNMQSDNMLIDDINFCDDRWMPYSLYPSHRYTRANAMMHNQGVDMNLIYVGILYNLFFIIGAIYYWCYLLF